MCGVFLGIISGLVLMTMLVATVFILLLSRGPIEVPVLRERAAAMLEKQLNGQAHASIGRTFLARGKHGPSLQIENFVLKDNQERTLVAAPQAEISVATLALLTGQLAISGLEFSGLDVKLAVLPDGQMAVSAGQGDAMILPAPATGTALQPADIFAAVFVAASSKAPFLGQMQRIGLTNGKLEVDDRRLQSTIAFSRLNVSLDRLGPGGIDFSASALSEAGPFSVRLLARANIDLMRLVPKLAPEVSDNSPYVIDFEGKDLPVHELLLAFGQGHQAVDISMPLSLKGNLGFSNEGKLQAAQGKFAFGAGFFRVDDPEAAPVQTDEILGSVNFDPQGQRFVLPVIEYFAGLTHIAVEGEIALSKDNIADHRVHLAGTKLVFAADKPGEKPLNIDSLVLDGAVPVDLTSATIEKMEFKGAELTSILAFKGQNTPDGAAISGNIEVSHTTIRAFLALWPGFLVPDLQTWLTDHVQAGVIDKGRMHFAYDAATIKAMKQKLPIPDESMVIDMVASGGTMTPLPGLPPMTGIEGTGHVTGTTASFNINKAEIDTNNRRLNISDAKFSIPDTRPQKLNPALISAHVQGTVDAAVDLLSREVLKKFNNVPGEPSQYKGALEGNVDIAFKIGKTATPDDISVKTSLNTSGLSVEKVLGNERLDNANLAIVITKTLMSVKGEGRMFGAPVAVDLRKAGTAPTDASLTFTMDEATRQKRGIDFGPGFSGPVLIKATTQLADGDRSKAEAPSGETRALVDIDLTKANIEGVLPGWSKPAGKPGRCTFALTIKEGAMNLDQFALDGGNASFRGTIQLDGASKFQSAKFSAFRLSPSDDLRLDIQKEGELLKITGRGGATDARPFISDLLAHSRAKAVNGQDMDLDLKVNVLNGFNRQRLEGLDLKLRRRSGAVQRVQASGRLSGSPFKIVPQDSAEGPILAVSTENAGGLLEFLDMYRKMEGGSLSLTVRPGAEHTTGSVQIRNFVLNDEPALRAVLNQNNANNGPDGPNRARFSRLQGDFDRSDGRIDINDAAMYGQQVGATLEGMIDYGRDRVDLAGNLVPAYELNNLFSKIPLVGPLLGGGKNEGLFAINFRVTGAASAPTLRVDPLSAIAPGIFRKILGVADGTQFNQNNRIPAPPTGPPQTGPMDLVPQQ